MVKLLSLCVSMSAERYDIGELGRGRPDAGFLLDLGAPQACTVPRNVGMGQSRVDFAPGGST
ncbi:MAG TPA: hypothetical protein VN772_04440 [Solirubrobacteraceae bacterium]|nr:hypothetical protein [Solirubrobacteraceae bacterium]